MQRFLLAQVVVRQLTVNGTDILRNKRYSINCILRKLSSLQGLGLLVISRDMLLNSFRSVDAGMQQKFKPLIPFELCSEVLPAF